MIIWTLQSQQYSELLIENFVEISMSYAEKFGTFGFISTTFFLTHTSKIIFKSEQYFKFKAVFLVSSKNLQYVFYLSENV